MEVFSAGLDLNPFRSTGFGVCDVGVIGSHCLSWGFPFEIDGSVRVGKRDRAVLTDECGAIESSNIVPNAAVLNRNIAARSCGTESSSLVEAHLSSISSRAVRLVKHIQAWEVLLCQTLGVSGT